MKLLRAILFEAETLASLVLVQRCKYGTELCESFDMWIRTQIPLTQYSYKVTPRCIRRISGKK